MHPTRVMWFAVNVEQGGQEPPFLSKSVDYKRLMAFQVHIAVVSAVWSEQRV